MTNPNFRIVFLVSKKSMPIIKNADQKDFCFFAAFIKMNSAVEDSFASHVLDYIVAISVSVADGAVGGLVRTGKIPFQN